MAENTGQNLIVLSLILLISTIYVVVNLPERFQIGTIYTVMLVFSILVFVIPFGKAPGLELKGRANVLGDVLFGVIPGVAWIIFASIFAGTALSIAFSLSIPATFAVVSAGFNVFVTIFYAPLIESVFFEGGIRKLLLGLKLRPALATIIVAGTFSAFHLFAYTRGDYAAVTTPFISAAFFSLGAGALFLLRKNIITPIIFHAIVNGFVLFRQLS